MCANIKYWIVAAALAIAFTFQCALSSADDAATERTKPQESAPLLAGPTVEEEADDDATMTRTGIQQRVGIRAMQPPLRIWLRLVRSLDLSTEQQQQAEELTLHYRQAVRQFELEHRDEIRALQSKTRTLRERETRDPASLRELREQLQAIRANGPDAAELQKAVWELLEESQQEDLRASIAQWQAQRAERMRLRGSRPVMRGDESRPAQRERPDRDLDLQERRQEIREQLRERSRGRDQRPVRRRTLDP